MNIFTKTFDFSRMVGTIFNCAGELSGNDKDGHSVHYGLETDKKIYGYVFKTEDCKYIAYVQDIAIPNSMFTIKFKHFETLCKKLKYKFDN